MVQMTVTGIEHRWQPGAGTAGTGDSTILAEQQTSTLQVKVRHTRSTILLVLKHTCPRRLVRPRFSDNS